MKKAYLILMAACMLLFGVVSVSADPGSHQPQSHTITAPIIDVMPAMATDVQPQVFSAELEQVYAPPGSGSIARPVCNRLPEDSAKPGTIYVHLHCPHGRPCRHRRELQGECWPFGSWTSGNAPFPMRDCLSAA